MLHLLSFGPDENSIEKPKESVAKKVDGNTVSMVERNVYKKVFEKAFVEKSLELYAVSFVVRLCFHSEVLMLTD